MGVGRVDDEVDEEWLIRPFDGVELLYGRSSRTEKERMQRRCRFSTSTLPHILGGI